MHKCHVLNRGRCKRVCQISCRVTSSLLRHVACVPLQASLASQASMQQRFQNLAALHAAAALTEEQWELEQLDCLWLLQGLRYIDTDTLPLVNHMQVRMCPSAKLFYLGCQFMALVLSWHFVLSLHARWCLPCVLHMPVTIFAPTCLSPSYLPLPVQGGPFSHTAHAQIQTTQSELSTALQHMQPNILSVAPPRHPGKWTNKDVVGGAGQGCVRH